jgi:hypothetical protein
MPVFIHGNKRILTVTAAPDESALRADGGLTGDLGHGRRLAEAAAVIAATRTARIAPAPAVWIPRRFGNEGGAEQIRDAGVVVEPKLVFLGGLVDARAARVTSSAFGKPLRLMAVSNNE